MIKKVTAYIEIEVRDKDEIIIHHEKKEANSLVRAWIDVLYTQFAVLGLPNCKDTNGVTRTIPSSQVMVMNGAAGDLNAGVHVGSGSTAVAVTDYRLATLILPGSIAGKLAYLIETFTTPSTLGNTHSVTTSRGFTNSSGASITVNEVGLVFYSTSLACSFMVDRTLMSFSIPNGATGTITYTIQISV